LSVETTIPGHPDPEAVKGRIVTLEFASCYLVGTYVVNAGQNLKASFLHLSVQISFLTFSFKTLGAKDTWNKHFFAYLNLLDKKKPVIWAGDLNVAPTELDLAHPKANWNKTAGYTEAETTAFKKFLNPPSSAGADDGNAGKFMDVWRDLHPYERGYTYFSYRFNCRMKGIGWRIDGCTYMYLSFRKQANRFAVVVSERLKEHVKMASSFVSSFLYFPEYLKLTRVLRSVTSEARFTALLTIFRWCWKLQEIFEIC
jgi:exodeoxyribonuclease III